MRVESRWLNVGVLHWRWLSVYCYGDGDGDDGDGDDDVVAVFGVVGVVDGLPRCASPCFRERDADPLLHASGRPRP